MNRQELLAAAWKLPELKSMPKRDFIRWLAKNDRLYGYFRRFAQEAIDKKRTKFSAYMIRERVRWYTNVEYSGRYKISNNLTPYIGRLLAVEMPELNAIFSFKTAKGQTELF